jgi:hypothetical protein
MMSFERSRSQRIGQYYGGSGPQGPPVAKPFIRRTKYAPIFLLREKLHRFAVSRTSVTTAHRGRQSTYSGTTSHQNTGRFQKLAERPRLFTEPLGSHIRLTPRVARPKESAHH